MAKILLVEDDRSLREIYGVRLLAEGYDIVSAGDGEEALAAAIREKPDLIVSDVMMPKMSGFEMLDLLRANDATKDIKVIMMTALSSDTQRERGEQLGADRYLVKSQVGIEDVVAAVHEVLGDREAQQPASHQSPINQMPTAAPNIAASVSVSQLPPAPVQMPPVVADMNAQSMSMAAPPVMPEMDRGMQGIFASPAPAAPTIPAPAHMPVAPESVVESQQPIMPQQQPMQPDFQVEPIPAPLAPPPMAAPAPLSVAPPPTPGPILDVDHLAAQEVPPAANPLFPQQ